MFSLRSTACPAGPPRFARHNPKTIIPLPHHAVRYVRTQSRRRPPGGRPFRREDVNNRRTGFGRGVRRLAREGGTDAHDASAMATGSSTRTEAYRQRPLLTR